MVSFDDAELKRLLERKKNVEFWNWFIFALSFISALIAAILAKSAYENYLGVEWNIHLAALIVAVVFLLGFVNSRIFVVARAKERTRYAIAKRIASGLYSKENILKDGTDIILAVGYEGDEITLSRQNFLREESGDTARFSQGRLAAINRLTFNLEGLKNYRSSYNGFGEEILNFIFAYYSVNGGYKSVTVIDQTGKNPENIAVLKDGNLCKNCKKNYFIKRGLVK